MEADLATTNLLLGVMAVVSALEAVLLIAIGVVGWSAYRRVTRLVDELEQRHIAPTMARLNAVLEDVKGVTGMVKEETERVDHAIRNTIDRVDDTAGRVRASWRTKTGRFVGLVRGVRVALDTVLQPGASRAAGRV